MPKGANTKAHMDALYRKMTAKVEAPASSYQDFRKREKARAAANDIIKNTDAQNMRSTAAAIEKLPNKLPVKPGFKRDNSRAPGPVKNFVDARMSTAKKNLKALGLGGESAAASTGPKNLAEVVKSPTTRKSKNIILREDSYTQAEINAANKLRNERNRREDAGMPPKRPPKKVIRPKSRPVS